MRRTLFLFLAIGVLAPACQRNTEPSLTPASGTRSAPPIPDGYAPLSDAQIAGVTAAAHSNELQQARIAMRRAVRKDVRDYARMLIAHHEKALNESRALENRIGIEPGESNAASDLLASNSELVVKLNDVKRGDFDREFVAAQVGNAEEILAVIDARLLPEARNGELRAAIEALRPMIESHLEIARELERKLQ